MSRFLLFFDWPKPVLTPLRHELTFFCSESDKIATMMPVRPSAQEAKFLSAKHKIKYFSLVLALLLILAVVLIRTAWICDDAYITFRTVDNFICGYGLTWNIAERVQTYSNPLWMFMISGLYFFTQEMYFSVVIFSLLVSFVAVILLAFRVAPSAKEAIMGLALLLFSKAFMDYSTSGLENPLAHLLLAAFIIIYIRDEFTATKVFRLSLIAGLAAFNRMDTILLYLPALIYSLFKVKNTKKYRALSLGFLPFILWEFFAVFYYGFPFPNSAYAKLKTGIGGVKLAKQGVLYLLNSFRLDPLTLGTIVLAIIIVLIKNRRTFLPLTLGIFLYIVYVIKVGGDFMSGRFLAAPFFLSVALITQFRLASFKTLLLLLLALTVFGLNTPYPPPRSNASYFNPDFDEVGIADERGFYYQQTGLLKAIREKDFPSLSRDAGLKARAEDGVVINSFIGCFGFYAGPNVHIIDELGIGDPLLARLPPVISPRWRVGHYWRVIPAGYIETLRQKRFLFEDKNLETYYRKLYFITRGHLWNFRRIWESIRMNLGGYNSLIDEVAYRYPLLLKVDLSEIKSSRPREMLWEDVGNREFGADGIQVGLDRTYQAKAMEISIDSRNDYKVLYYLYTRKVGFRKLKAREGPLERLGFQTIETPKRARRLGFNRIIILPISTEGKHRIGHLKLLPGVTP